MGGDSTSELYNQAVKLMNLRQYDKALEIPLKLIKRQKYEEALEILKKLTIDESTNYNEWFDKEQVLVKLKDSGVIEQIEPKDPENYIVCIDKGKILAKLNKHEEASKAYAKALEIAIKSIDNQKYEEALEILEKLTDSRFKNYKLWIGRYRALVKLNRLKEASKAYDTALAIAVGLIENQKYEEALEALSELTTEGPENYSAWIDKGQILNKLNNQEESSKAYDKALEIALKLIGNQKYEEGLKALNELIVAEPKNYRALKEKGLALIERSRTLPDSKHEEALKDYNEVHAIAVSLINEQKHQEAFDVLDKLTAMDSENYKALNDKGRALAGLDRYEEAIDIYNKALAVNSSYTRAYNEKGIALRESKNYQEAIQVFTSVIENHRKDAYALTNLGITYYYIVEYAKAIKQLDKAKKLKPEDPTSFHYKGLILYSLKEYDEACKLLGEASDRYEDKECRAYAEVLYQQSLAYLKINKEEEAKKRLKSALEIFKKAINKKDSLYNSYNYKGLVLRELARLEEDKKKRRETYQEALDCFEKAINQPKKCAAAYRNKALVLHDLKKYAEAIEVLNKAIEIDPNSIFSRNNKAVTLYSLRNYTDSLKEFQKVLKIKPNDIYALMNKGLALYSLDRYKEAEEVFKKIIDDLNKQHPDAWNNLGLVFYETERYGEALEAFDKAKRLDPYNCSHYNNKILAFAGVGDKKGFLTAFEEAKEKFPNNAEAWNNKAICHAQFNEYEEAISSFDQAIAIDQSYTLAIKNKALVLRMLGKKEEEKKAWDKAIEEYENYLKDCIDDVYVINEKAFAYRKLGEYKRAKEELYKALSINNRYAEAWNNLGLCNLGTPVDYNEALKNFQGAIDIDPGYAEAWVNKGITLLKLEIYKEGYAALIKAFCLYKGYTKVNANNRRALYNIGLILYDLHHYNAAISAFKKATSTEGENLQLDNPNAWNNLGLSYYQLGKYNDAIEAFNRAAQFNPKNTEILHNLGLAYCKSGYYLQAVSFFENAYDIDRSNVYSLYSKGRALIELKEYKKAGEIFNEIITEIDKRLPECKNKDILEEKDNFELCCMKANAIFYIMKCNRNSDSPIEEIIEEKCRTQNNYSHNYIDYSHDYLVKGIIYYLCGQYSKALENFKDSEENLKKSDNGERKCPDLLYNKGIILYKLGEYEEALDAFEKSTNLDPHCVNVWNYKGLTHIKLNKVEEAKDSFETATQINPKEAWGYINLSKICLNYEDIEGAKSKLKNVHKLNKHIEDKAIKSRFWSLKGQIELENEEPNYQEAVRCFGKAVSANPEEISNHLWYAYVRYLNADLLYNKENIEKDKENEEKAKENVEKTKENVEKAKENVEKAEIGNNNSPSNQNRQYTNTKYQQVILSIIRDLENVPFFSTKQERKYKLFSKLFKHAKKLNNSLEKEYTEKNLKIMKENEAYLLYFLGYLFYNLKDYFSAKEKFRECLSLNSGVPAEKSARQLSLVCDQHIHTLWWNWWLNTYTSTINRLTKGSIFLILVSVLLMLLIPPDLANNIIYILPFDIASRIPEGISPVDWKDKVTQNALLSVIIIFILLSPEIKRIKSEQIEIELYTPPNIVHNLYPSTPPSEFAKITEKLADPGGLKKSILSSPSAELPSAGS